MVVLICCVSALIIHLTYCIICYIFIKTEIMKISMHLFPLVFFVPVWGILIAINAEWCTRRKLTDSKKVDLEQLGLPEGDYRTMGLAEEELERTVVPLEEAIYINNAETRRKMMIDILQQDPKQYVELLQKARFDEDIEVSHYASMAIMEVQRDYELELRRLEQLLNDDPDNTDIIEKCLGTYKSYIQSGLMADNILSLQRLRYKALLEKRLEWAGADRQLYYDAVDNLIEMNNLNEAQDILDKAMKKWPKDDRGWMLRVKYYYKIKNSRMIQYTISRMENIYLTPTGKDFVNSWKS